MHIAQTISRARRNTLLHKKNCLDALYVWICITKNTEQEQKKTADVIESMHNDCLFNEAINCLVLVLFAFHICI